MTNRNPLIRPAMTAIAAVLACSTPSFAQEADPPAAETPAPIVTAPVTPAPVVADPIVTEPEVAAEPAAPAEAVAAPAARRATTTRPPAARARPAPARAASAAPSPAAAAPSSAEASAPAVADAPAVEPLPVEPEAAPLAAPAATDETSSTDTMIPALAAGALAILALAAAVLFLRRRKRHAGQAEDRAMRDSQLGAIDDAQPAMRAEPEPAMMVEPEVRPDPVKPAVVAAPAFATHAAPVVAAPSFATKAAPVVGAAPVANPTPEDDGPVTDLPEDFDLSRFGYNVQEAYKGPTEDNPSLSMKNRLTRARGMDQLERNLDAEVEAATGEPVLTEDELNPPAETSADEPAVDPATGDHPPSVSDQKPN